MLHLLTPVIGTGPTSGLPGQRQAAPERKAAQPSLGWITHNFRSVVTMSIDDAPQTYTQPMADSDGSGGRSHVTLPN